MTTTTEAILTALPGMSAVYVINASQGYAYGAMRDHTTLRQILAHHMNAKGNPRQEYALNFIAGFIAPVGLDDVWANASCEENLHVRNMISAAAHVAREVIEIEKSRGWLARNAQVAA